MEENILRNEKHAGNAILQKTFYQDFLTKKMVENTGQVTQYNVKGSHIVIISEEIFNLVQDELKNRHGRHQYSTNIFTERIFCGECGGQYDPKVQHFTDK